MYIASWNKRTWKDTVLSFVEAANRGEFPWDFRKTCNLPSLQKLSIKKIYWSVYLSQCYVGKRYPTNKSQIYVSNWFTIAFPDCRFLRFSYFFLSPLTPQKTILLHCFALKGSMFNGDGNAFSSRYVMLCHTSDR